MRTRTKWLIFGALLVAAALAALPIFHVTLKLDLPPASGGSQPQPLPSGWSLWVAAWIICALVGFATICVFVFRALRRLLSWRPNP